MKIPEESRDIYLCGKEAWAHYELYQKIEVPIVYQLQKKRIRTARRKLKDRKSEIEDALEAAKGKFCNITGFMSVRDK